MCGREFCMLLTWVIWSAEKFSIFLEKYNQYSSEESVLAFRWYHPETDRIAIATISHTINVLITSDQKCQAAPDFAKLLK